MAGQRRHTYADLEKLPENMVGELIDGELFASPRPRSAHAFAMQAIANFVGGPFNFGRGGPGGWWIVAEPDVRLHGNVVVPDLAGWRRERLAVPPRDSDIEVAPDWVCEIVSPSTARLDRRIKKPLYAKFGVSHLWMVDPFGMTVEVHQLERERWVSAAVAATDEKVRLAPFDAIELDLATWWLPDPPTS